MKKKIEYLKTLPRKRVGVGVLLFDTNGKVLILKPSYKDGWTVPGGVVDELESPLDAAIRESKEEIGLDVKIVKCLAVDFARNNLDGYISESLQFIFLGNTLIDEDIEKISIDNDEIIEMQFVSFDDAIELLGDNLSKRLNGLDRGIGDFVFMENGVPIV